MADVLRAVLPGLNGGNGLMERYGLETGRFIVLTVHRARTADDADALSRIMVAMAAVGVPVLFPVHPRTKRLLTDGVVTVPKNVTLSEPLNYRDMIAAVRSSRALVTDSGGLQKEAYWLHVACVTLRPNTEWVDTVAVGANALAEPAGLAEAVRAARFPPDAPPLYGDGHAAERVAAALYS